MALQIRRGTDAERQTITPAEGELVLATDTNRIYVGGKISPSETLEVGGILVSGSLSNDTNPTLAADLNLNNNNITGTGSINIDGTITASGNINLGDGAEDNVIVGGQIGSSLIPGSDGLYDLGAALSKWNNVYINSIDVATTITADDIEIAGNIRDGSSTLIYDGLTGALNATSIAVTTATVGTMTGDIVGSVFGDDSTAMVDAVGKVLSNGSITIDGSRINGDIDGPAWETNFIANGSKVIGFGQRGADLGTIFIDGNDVPLVLRGVSTGTGGPTSTIQGSRFTGTTKDTLVENDYIGNIGFDGYNGTDFKRGALISTTVESGISGGNFDTDMTVSVLKSDGLYNQFVFQSDGLFRTNGVNLFTASEVELSGLSAIAVKGSLGFGDARNAPVVFDGSAFKTITTTVGVPTGPTATGKAGQVSGDANYVYFCHTDDNWVRVAKDNTWT